MRFYLIGAVGFCQILLYKLLHVLDTHDVQHQLNRTLNNVREHRYCWTLRYLDSETVRARAACLQVATSLAAAAG